MKLLHNDIIYLHSHVLEIEYHALIVCPTYVQSMSLIENNNIKPCYSERPCMFNFNQLLKTNQVKEIH